MTDKTLKSDAPKAGQTLDDYKTAVYRLAEARSPLLFNNDNLSHAAVVVEAMIKYSQQDVLIYDSHLSEVAEKSPTFYSTLIEHLLDQGHAIKIVLESPKAKQGASKIRVLESLSNLVPGLLDVRVQSPEFRNEIGALCDRLSIVDTVHYAVGDDRMFRLEFPSGARKAYCCFNNPELARELRVPFDKAFETCEPYLHE